MSSPILEHTRSILKYIRHFAVTIIKRMSTNYTQGADRATHTINCKYAYNDDIQDIKAEQNGANSKSTRVYEHLLNQGDKIMKRGEIAYVSLDTERVDIDQQPFVRTVLNGKRIKSKTTDPKEQLIEMEKSIRTIGFVKTDIVYSGTSVYGKSSHMQVPAIVSGKTTVVNSGTQPLIAGKAAQTYLLPPGSRNQHKNYNRMDCNRTIIGLKPLEMYRDWDSDVGEDGRNAMEDFIDSALGDNRMLNPDDVQRKRQRAARDRILAVSRACTMHRAQSVAGVVLTNASGGGQADGMLCRLFDPVPYSKIKKVDAAH